MNDDPTIEVAGGGDDDSTAAGVTASFKVDENAPDAIAGAAGPVLGLITLSDPDMGDTHTVTVNDDRFQVIRHPAEGEEGSSLWLTLKSGETLDFEDDAGSTIMLTLTVTDSNGGSATTDVTIEVMNVNEPPTASGELPTVIGTAGEALGGDQTRIALGEFFKDLDEGDTLTYAATGGPGWLDFEVDEETGHGVLSGAPPAAGADAEASHTVTITATDGGGLSASRSFTLVVDDGNDPITGIEFTNADGEKLATERLEISFEENKPGDPGGTLLGTFSAVDPDSEDHPNGMITWLLPRGEQRFEIDPKTGELRLKEGVELNFESPTITDNISNREIELRVTATDGGEPKQSRTEELFIEVTNANDAPEAVDTDIDIGWWVTRNEDLETGAAESDGDEYAAKGGWLEFRLERWPDDQRPAFSDPDIVDARTLTYSLVDSPSWLEINPQTGLMQNRAGMVADEGLYTVTARATDSGGAKDDFTFRLAVAVSDFEDDGTLAGGAASPDDNGGPEIDADAMDIGEDAQAGAVVAKFTVEDEELPLGPFHPWGRLDVNVSSSWETGTRPDTGLDVPGPSGYNDRVAQVGEAVGFGDYFSVHHTGTDGDTASYEVRLTFWGARQLDADDERPNGLDEVTFTIRAADGTFDPDPSLGDGLGDPARMVTEALASTTEGADYDEVAVDIDGVNEPPEYVFVVDDPPLGPPPEHVFVLGRTPDEASNNSPLRAPPGARQGTPENIVDVDQREEGDGAVTHVYLNLTDLFHDPEDGDDDVEYSASITAGAPWLSLHRLYNSDAEGIRTGPQEWRHIDNDRNGAEADRWGPGVDPEDTDIVLILRVDRDPGEDGGSAAQDADGMVEIIATDEDGSSSTTDIVVEIDDENLAPPTETNAPVDPNDPDERDPSAMVVTLSGPPREGSTLRATFHEERDPDFTGAEARDPILVRYQWWTYEHADVNTNGLLDFADGQPVYAIAPTPMQETVGRADDTVRYEVQQGDVGGRIEGRVIYYELFDGEIVQSPDTDTGIQGVQGYASMQTAQVQNTPDEETMSFAVETAFVNDDGDDVALGTEGGMHVLRITPSYSPSASRQDLDRPVNEDGDVVGDPNAGGTANTNGGYNFNYEWQYSPNGRTNWQAIRDLNDIATFADENALTPDPDGRWLELPASVESGYVRLVVIYEDEGDGRGNQVENKVNRIESDPVKVGEIEHAAAGTTANTLQMHIDDGTDTNNSAIQAGWTLHVNNIVVPDNGRGSVKVEWQVGGAGSSNLGFAFLTVGEGEEYTVTADDRGQIRAVVTRYDEDGGVVSITTVGGSAPIAAGSVNVVPRTLEAQNMPPVFAQGEPRYVDLGKAPDANGKYEMLTGMIDLQSLFTDPEGDPIILFNVSAPATGFFFGGTFGGTVVPDQIPSNPLDLWHDLGEDLVGTAPGAEGDQILLVNERTGEVEYHSTQAQDHGGVVANGVGSDGNGNWITVRVIGTDSGFRSSQGLIDATNLSGGVDPDGALPKAVHLRIDAAPTGFQVSDDFTTTATVFDNAGNTGNNVGSTGDNDAATPLVVPTPPGSPFDFGFDPDTDGPFPVTYIPYTVREHTGDQVVTARDQLVAAGGIPTETARVIARIDVQDDNQASHAYGQYMFTVSDDRFEVVRVPTDASQGILRLKTGENLDFEALESPMRERDADGENYSINDDNRRIELVVTATPVDPEGSDPHDPITLGIVVNVINVPEPDDPDADDVPGLEDDESDDTDTATDLDDAGEGSTVAGQRAETVGDDTDTTDNTGSDDDDDHDGGWWEVASLDDGLF